MFNRVVKAVVVGVCVTLGLSACVAGNLIVYPSEQYEVFQGFEGVQDIVIDVLGGNEVEKIHRTGGVSSCSYNSDGITVYGASVDSNVSMLDSKNPDFIAKAHELKDAIEGKYPELAPLNIEVRYDSDSSVHVTQALPSGNPPEIDIEVGETSSSSRMKWPCDSELSKDTKFDDGYDIVSDGSIPKEVEDTVLYSLIGSPFELYSNGEESFSIVDYCSGAMKDYRGFFRPLAPVGNHAPFNIPKSSIVSGTKTYVWSVDAPYAYNYEALNNVVVFLASKGWTVDVPYAYNYRGTSYMSGHVVKAVKDDKVFILKTGDFGSKYDGDELANVSVSVPCSS